MEASRILAVLDPGLGDSRAAVRAATLGRRAGARVTLAVYEDRQTIVESGILGEALTRDALEAWQAGTAGWLEKQAVHCREADIETATEIVLGRPIHEKILAAVESGGYDLVLKDSRAGSRLRRALFTPLDWHLLRACPVPLMLVKADSSDTPRRIAAAVDPLHERGKPALLDQRILRAARDMAACFGAEWHAVHACQTQPLGAGSPIEGPSLHFEEVREKIAGHHTRALRDLVADFELPDDHVHFIDAPVSRAIVDFTREHEIDTLVMGTVRRTGLSRVLMGSTAEAILDAVNCDVLAIKPEDFPRGGT
jgi:universal stress protein E